MSEKPQGEAIPILPLTLADVAALDATYTPIPPFNEWKMLDVNRALLEVQAAWDAAVAFVERRRATANSDDLRQAVGAAMRAAALDTGAIEGMYEVDRGFTISVALQTIAWQAALSEIGANVPALFAAQLAAYELALDVATKKLPITEAWIRRLHEVICAPQDTYKVLTKIGWQERDLVKGHYKDEPNHVRLLGGGVHAYAPVLQTPAEMHRLVEELSSTDFEKAHPALQAAYSHYAFVAIHPFQDGNGRVARALASVYLYRAASTPLLIFSDQKDDYFEALAQADRGDGAAFLEFVVDRATDTLRFIGDQVAASAARKIEELRVLLTAQSGLAHVELDQIAMSLLTVVANEVDEQLKGLQMPPGVAVNRQNQSRTDQWGELEGYRRPTSQNDIYLAIYGSVQPPAQANVDYAIRALVARDRDKRMAIRVEVVGKPEAIDARPSDIRPDMAAALRLRVSAWVAHLISLMLEELKAVAEKSLRGSGYLS
ncbi:MAG TPA: Fic family protein [Candidatus Nitrosotalea sp.]|nr:Fic family protein [Candidatus Nitrosotalea sp.]